MLDRRAVSAAGVLFKRRQAVRLFHELQHSGICSLFLLPEMDSVEQVVIKFLLYLMPLEVEMRMKTREMEEQLMAGRAALEAMENKRLMLMSDRDEKLAEKNTVDKLVADFLQADSNGDFEAQKAMENQIVALISRDAGEEATQDHLEAAVWMSKAGDGDDSY